VKLTKKVFFQIHSWIGIKLSILFFIVCFSGTLATLSHEMDWLFFPEIRAQFQGSYASKNDMVDDIRHHYPDGAITYWAASNEPYLCEIVYVHENNQRHFVVVNPYTGKVQGDTTLTFQRFFRDLHYYLFIPFQIGHFTVLIFGFMLFISMTTALLFYKKWWRKLFDLKVGKGRLVFYRSLHRLVGIWSVPFAILFSITGIWYFVERTNIGGVSDIANPSYPQVEEVTLPADTSISASYQLDYDRAVQVAQQTIPNLKIKDILPANEQRQVIYINGKSHVPLVRNRANRVYVNPETYELVDVQRAEDIHVVMYLNDIADPLHFGYWGGLLTKVIWFFGGLAISGLVLTGIWKYINGLVVMVMTAFMYYFLTERYAASVKALFIVGSGWILFAFAGWYLFVYKLRKEVIKN